MSTTTTARASNQVRCHRCGQLHVARSAPSRHATHCARCATSLHGRIPNSVSNTWALVIAGLILYVPANLYPVMTIELYGQPQPSTIYTGVRDLFASGSWIVGLLVFAASIVVPLAKLLGLSFLLVTVQARSTWRPRDRTLLFRVIRTIGRWSMLDVFLLSILVALVKLGMIATITPGVGATAFAAVVIITMFAAESFDPRLMWDVCDRDTSNTPISPEGPS